MLDKLKKLIVEKLNVAEDKITLDTSFVDDLGADSLDAVELVMTVEDEFDITISDEEAQSLVTVGDLIKVIESKK